jgi:hypothetical protein
MLIAYDPMTDVLSITLQAAPAAQTQQQGTIAVSLDPAGAPVSVAVPNASTILWENGGQVNVLLPEAQTVVTETTVSQPVVTQQVVERRTAL